MDPLAGWTVAVTAQRRAEEQTALLQRRGADVLLAPLVTASPAPEAAVRAATSELVGAPVDVFVATSAVGLRTWMAMAWTWDQGERLLSTLRGATVVVRGAKAYGALAGEDVPVHWRAPSETMDEVLARLLAEGVRGRTVGVQLHGGELAWFVDALRHAGARVVAVPVYRVEATTDARPIGRIEAAAARGELDAVTFTSAAAVKAAAAGDGLVGALVERGVTVACVGPVTAAAASDAGLPDLVVAGPSRLGSMVRALGDRLADRGRTLECAGVHLRVQGARLAVDGVEARLTPRERRLLEAMLATEGAVLSKERLAATVWDAPVDEHTVEVAVNRLRRKLGPAALALETTARRGYRIAI